MRLSSCHSTHSPRVQWSMPSCQHPWEEVPLSSDLSSGAWTPSLRYLLNVSKALRQRQSSSQPFPTLLPAVSIPLPTHPPTMVPHLSSDSSRPLTAKHHKYLVSHVRVLQVYPWNSSWTCLILSIPCLSSGPHIPHLDYPITWHYSS